MTSATHSFPLFQQHFYSLPQEILQTISQYLNPLEQSQCRQVCKLWNELLTHKDIPRSIKQLKGLMKDTHLEVAINDKSLSGKTVIDSCSLGNRYAFLLKDETSCFLLVTEGFFMSQMGMQCLLGLVPNNKYRLRFGTRGVVEVLDDISIVSRTYLRNVELFSGPAISMTSALKIPYPEKKHIKDNRAYDISSISRLFAKKHLFQTYPFDNDSIQIMNAKGRKIIVLPPPNYLGKPDEFLMEVKNKLLLVSIRVSQTLMLRIYDTKKKSLLGQFDLNDYEKKVPSFFRLKDKVIIPVRSTQSQLLTLIHCDLKLSEPRPEMINTSVHSDSILKVILCADQLLVFSKEIDQLKLKFLPHKLTSTVIVEDSIEFYEASTLLKDWIVDNRYVGVMTLEKNNTRKITYVDVKTRTIINELAFDSQRELIPFRNGEIFIHQGNMLSVPKNLLESPFKVKCRAMIRTACTIMNLAGKVLFVGAFALLLGLSVLVACRSLFKLLGQNFWRAGILIDRVAPIILLTAAVSLLVSIISLLVKDILNAVGNRLAR